VQAGFKRVVRRHVGRLPVWEWRLRILRAPETARLRWGEHSEVRNAKRALPALPSAEVATIIPTYKRGHELFEAIDSALAQTVRDQIVVVVDDAGGLPDSLPDDPRLFAISLTRNYGTVGVTRNVGIRITQSRFLAFLDDDNTWEPDHLELALASHRRGNQLTYSSLRRVDESGSLVDVFSIPFDRRYARDHPFADASAIVVQRGKGVVFSRVPRRKGDFPREDWEFVYRLSRRLRTELVPEPTVTYRVHGGSYFSAWGSGSTTA
jgi:glycosyltransferase involved in cell wall biosynthesis